ncbi:MAG: hypothetical protein DRN91_05925 [Candidatus Alkanophagales archaeon]|nr:MAG: hypothetical protein DRN91_05925 [Candidatus Alkanophagales archaeon]
MSVGGRYRGLDFYLKWSLGNWAEEITYKFCREEVAPKLGVHIYRYGYSAGRIPKSLVEFKEIQRERSRLEFGKRPNFLLFSQQFAQRHDEELSRLMRKPDSEVEDLVRGAVLAIEVEQSMWSVKRATTSLSFTVKEEDVQPLKAWVHRFEVPIVVFQVFVDELHASPLEEILNKGKLDYDPTIKKKVYFLEVSPQTRLADIKNVGFYAKVEFDEKGRLVPFVMLEGGTFTNMNTDAIRKLAEFFKK